jgi:hypothetical protein
MTERYAALRVLEPAADQFRRLVRVLTAQADRDLTHTEVLAAAAAYCLEHVGEVAEQLSTAADDRAAKR